MTPVWRAVSTAVALVAGFMIPIVALITYLGLADMGPVAFAGLVALVGAVTLLVKAYRGRLRF